MGSQKYARRIANTYLANLLAYSAEVIGVLVAANSVSHGRVLNDSTGSARRDIINEKLTKEKSGLESVCDYGDIVD